eukprot:gene13945-18702_t
MFPEKKKLKSLAKAGRSIEEIMVMRKFDRSDPISWPDPNRAAVLLVKKGSSPNTPNLPKLNAKSHSITDLVTNKESEDKDKIMESLMSYCRSLQKRVDELELQLVNVAEGNGRLHKSTNFSKSADYNQNYFTLSNARSVPGSPGLLGETNGEDRHVRIDSRKRRSVINQAIAPSSVGQYAMMDMVASIDFKVLNLREIFRKGDPLEQRGLAATLIAATIRGYLARCRLNSYRAGLREWKWTRCKPSIWVLDVMLANQSQLDAGFHLLQSNRNIKNLNIFFYKWSYISKKNAPLRRSVKQAAMEKIENLRLSRMRKVFDGLHAVTIGKFSKKNANRERRLLIDTIRLELSQKFQAQKKRLLDVRSIWNVFHGIYDKYRKGLAKARQYRFNRIVGRCFYAWSDYVYLVGVGLDRKRWLGPRKYELKYNQKRVDNFSKMRCKRFIFSAWKGYFHIQYEVKRRFQRKRALFIQNVFKAWVEAAKSQHKLRLQSYENWKGYQRILIHYPFNVWATHVKAVKNHHNEQIRIANSYLRWKWRQKLLRIVRVWRHQALYGRIDGLYTRQMLIKTVAEYKLFASSLEKTMANQTMELEECRGLVNNEIVKREDLEAKIMEMGQENNHLVMKNHHFEQELIKLESVIQSMIIINPRQVHHIKKLHPRFKFKDRNIILPPKAPHSAGGSAIISNPPSVAGHRKKGNLADDDGGDDAMSMNDSSVGGNDSAVDLDSFNENGLPGDNDDDVQRKADDSSVHSHRSGHEPHDPIKGLPSQLSNASLHSMGSVHSNNASNQMDTNNAQYSNLSEESLLLLSRAQWLVDRYKNKIKSDMMAEHMRNTVSLVASSAPYTNQFSQIPPTKQVFIPPTVKQTMNNNDMMEEYQHNVLSDGIAA